MHSTATSSLGPWREPPFAWTTLRAGLLAALIACCGCCQGFQHSQHATPGCGLFHSFLCGDSGVCTDCGEPNCDGGCVDSDSGSYAEGYIDSHDHVPKGSDYYDSPVQPYRPGIENPRESLPPGEPVSSRARIFPDGLFSWRKHLTPGPRTQDTRGQGAPSGTSPSVPSTSVPLAKEIDNETYPLTPVTVQSPLQQLNPLTRLRPSNDRDWRPEFRKLTRCEFNDDGSLALENVRNCRWLTDTDCVVSHYDREYDLADLKTVDFIVVPFNGMTQIAHTMLSFGFGRGDYVGVSIEIRQRRGGDNYSTTKGFVNEYELVYVVADERDLIPVRVLQRNSQVYIYRSTASPERVQKLFVDMMERTNKLAERPEFYNTLTNNCTTNIVQHINNLAPGRIPYDYRILLPGYSANLAYDLGLIENRLPFEEVRQRALANERVVKSLNQPDFSARIRR